jgi:tRNA-specific 2-thiouridylase
VLAIDARHNALIVGPASQLGRGSLQVENVSFVAGSPPPFPAAVTTKIRYTGNEVAATLVSATSAHGSSVREGESTIHVTLDEPLRDITPGQGAVFYQGEVVLGGGTISDTQAGENHPKEITQ